MHDRIKKEIKIITISPIIGFFLCFILLEVGLYTGGSVFISSQEKINEISLQKKADYRILALGDSTTAIGGKESWPSQLEEVLNDMSLGKNFSVINKGSILIDSYGILSNLEGNLVKYNPNIVIIMAGLNDVKKENNPESIFYKVKLFLRRFRSYRLTEQFWPEVFSSVQIDYDNTEKAYKNNNTIYNFDRIKEILDEKGIKLVIMQYPNRRMEPLKKVFKSEENIIFVDNENLFKETLKHTDYRALFVDKFAGDFGHCTKKGNRMIAENIVNILIKHNNKLSLFE